MPIIVFEQWDDILGSSNDYDNAAYHGIANVLQTLIDHKIDVHIFTNRSKTISNLSSQCHFHADQETSSLSAKLTLLSQLFPHIARQQIILISTKPANLGFYRVNGFAVIDASQYQWDDKAKRAAFYKKIISQKTPQDALINHLNDASFWSPLTVGSSHFPKGIKAMQKLPFNANFLAELKKIAGARLASSRFLFFKKQQHAWTKAFYETILQASSLNAIVEWLHCSTHRLQPASREARSSNMQMARLTL